MQTTLLQLLKGINSATLSGKGDPEISGIATDSRRVVPGSLFFALPGRRTDGKYFIEEALQRGAVAIVSEESPWVPPRVVLVQVSDIRAVLGKVAARFYHNPERNLKMMGIGGTSGKTVVTSLLKYLLDTKSPAGLLGTIHYSLGKRTLPAYRTTPEAVDLYAMLAQMQAENCDSCVMEVSSHGIDQQRINGLQFEQFAFLNLSEEHLDYHGSMEDYFSVYRDYISKNPPKVLVLGTDNEYSRRLAQEAFPKTQMVRFGLEEGADFRAKDIDYGEQDTRFTLVYEGGELRIVSPLLGEFNVHNVLAAIAMASLEGVAPEQSAAALLSFEGVRGRMEALNEGQSFGVIIDYAHTEASYRKALTMLRKITRNRLIAVFGCGGSRDPKIRPAITGTVQALTDYTIATSDNPRHEDIEEIFRDMKAGVTDPQKIVFIPDRKRAIATALNMAEPGDTVLIAGKGHETYQEFSDCVVPFDDRAVARKLLKEKGNP